MSFAFYMPTRLVHGVGSLDALPEIVHQLGLARPLVVTDEAVAATPGYRKAVGLLDEAKIDYAVFDECAIDARLHHIDSQTERILAEKRDGVICIGGGSVMSAGKAMAIAAANGGGGFERFVGIGGFRNKALPMIMAPTTAGSGAEVSQMTLVKDDDRPYKFIAGGPLSFPEIAILDPALIESCPRSVAAIALVDALTHCVDSYFNTSTTPLTAALSVEAARLLMASARGSIIDRDDQAMADNLLGAAMANMACGNARLGLAHCLSLPLEGGFDLTHGIGVGVLLPRVFRFTAPVAPDRVLSLAPAFGVDTNDGDPKTTALRIESAMYRLFDEIGFPRHYQPHAFDPQYIPEMAMDAGRGLYGEGYLEDPATRNTLIPSPNLRRATIAQGEELLGQCFI